MKKTVVVKAYAKINLSIDVIEKMDNGYHRIETVMQQVDLFDNITIESKGRAGLYANYKIKLTTDDENLPKNDDNLAYRAAVLMAETFCPFKDNNIHILLNKRIPVAAGLAGGSTDAAAVMLALCKLWKIKVPLKELCIIGAKIGSDIPFCLVGNGKNNPELGFSEDSLASSAALAEGIGEILSPVPSLNGWVVLVKPEISVSTATVYGLLTDYGVFSQEDLKVGQNAEIQRPNNKALVAGLEKQNTEQILKNMLNVLETVSLKEYPIIVYTKNKISENNAPAKVLMSGSGPTVFGYYLNENDAQKGYSLISNILLKDTRYRFRIYLVKLL